MHIKTQLRLLKAIMVLGILLLVLGHVVLGAAFASDTLGVQGFMLGAAMSAIGIICSLPTKIYLTILLMEHEQATTGAKTWADHQSGTKPSSQASLNNHSR